MSDDVTPALLDRYLTGECTPEEVQGIHVLLDTDANIRALLEQLRQVRLGAAAQEGWDTGHMWRRLEREIHEDGVAARPMPIPVAPDQRDDMPAMPGPASRARLSWRERRGTGPVQRFGRPSAWSTAAAFALGVMAAAFGWMAIQRHPVHAAGTSTLTYATANGERATITLPDGSTVALDVASRLEVPADYLAGNHTVRLVGEGLFTVWHHSRTPLTVVAGPATVRVLGTSFLVRKYATDTAATVAVRDGKVAVRSTVLSAAQQVTVGGAGVGTVHAADLAQFKFASGVLTLNDVPFPAAIAELDRWYDADIRLGDARLATLRMAGEFGAGSLAELSEILVNTYQVRVVRNGRVLTLYPR